MILKLNPDDLTLGDLDDFETAAGVSFDDAVKPVPVLELDPRTGEMLRKFDSKGRPVMRTKITTKAIIALVWIVGRRDNPAMTLADARNVKVTSLEINETPTADRGND